MKKKTKKLKQNSETKENNSHIEINKNQKFLTLIVVISSNKQSIKMDIRNQNNYIL